MKTQKRNLLLGERERDHVEPECSGNERPQRNHRSSHILPSCITSSLGRRWVSCVRMPPWEPRTTRRFTANSILILWGNMSLNDHEKMCDQVKFTESFKYPQEIQCMGNRGKALANITLQGDIFRHQFDGRPKTKQVAKITH